MIARPEWKKVEGVQLTGPEIICITDSKKALERAFSKTIRRQSTAGNWQQMSPPQC